MVLLKKEALSFLFHNINPRQTVLKNTLWLFIAEGFSRILTLFLLIYIARVFGAEEYGKFTFALSFVYLLSMFSDLGISSVVTRELTQKKEAEKDFSAIVSLKILLLATTGVLTFVGSFFIIASPEIRILIWILAIYNAVNVYFEIFYVFLRARERMEYESLAKLFHAILIVGFGFFVLFHIPSVKNMSFAYLSATFTTLIFLVWFFHRHIYRLQIVFRPKIWKRILSLSWPLALSGLFIVIHNQIDSVMMGFFGQITQTGWYNAAYKIIGITLIPMALISQAFYPVLSKSFAESQERFQRIWNHQMEAMIIIAVPMMTGGIYLARKIIGGVYGAEFLPATLAFQLLVIMGGILFISDPLQKALIVSHQQNKIFWCTLSGTLMNVILNVIIIPRYSLYGAAITAIASGAVIFFLLLFSVIHHTSVNPVNRKLIENVLVVFPSSALMYGIISHPLTNNFRFGFLIFLGAAVYFISLFSLRFWVKKVPRLSYRKNV